MAGVSEGSDDEYFCTLDPPTQDKALRELKEDPRERQGCVETFRELLDKQQAFRCPIDTRFLLAFLRARKFSQLEAIELMRRHLVMKTKMRNWFENVDPAEAGIMAVLKDGFAYPLPRRNENGCLLVVFNYGKIQPWSGRYTKKDVLRAIVCVTYFLFFTNETTQVNGIVIINDLSSMCFKHQALFTLEEQRLFYGGWHKSIPARIKKICLYNAGSFGDFVYMILKLVTPEKLTQRIVNCGSSLEMLYKEVSMEFLPTEYLPDDYEGPHGGTAAENVDRMIEDMLVPNIRERIIHLSDPEFNLDLSKSSPSLSMSFRKLNVE